MNAFLSHNLLDSKINTLLSMCQDTNLLNPVHGIVQNVVYHEESPPQYQASYLQSTTCIHYCLNIFLEPMLYNELIVTPISGDFVDNIQMISLFYTE